MKTKMVKTFPALALTVIWCLLASKAAYPSVTNEELGKMLLKNNYVKVTQDYDVYYSEGPTGSGKNEKGGWHPGIDYEARTPLTAYSPVNGVVDSFDKEGTGYGRVSIKIEGTNDYFIFLHLSKVNITAGQRIKIGDIIGKTGSTGAPSPHLHVEVRTGRSGAAYYFKSQKDTGVNKNPISVIAKYVRSNQSTESNIIATRPSSKSLIQADKVSIGRTADETLYEFILPASQSVETELQIYPNQEVLIHHFASGEPIKVNLGSTVFPTLQKPGTVIPLYTSRNCSNDAGVRAKVQYFCVQLNQPDRIKLYAASSVRIGILVKNR